jgi:AAA domain-containing protein
MEYCNMEEQQEIGKMKLAIVGYEQNGKSRLAATARQPILFHDFDNKRESLRGLPGVFVISYIDPIWPNQPTAAQDFLTTIGKLEQSLDLADLGFKVPKGTFVKTNVVDSMQTLGKNSQNYAMHNSPGLRREITFGGHKVFIPAGWDAVNAEMKEVENFVLRLMALPCDTIVVLHETSEEADGSTTEKRIYTGRADVYPPRYRMMLKYFPEVWRVKLTQIVADNKVVFLPRVYPLPNSEFDSGTTMFLDPIEEPNITMMLKKHELRSKQASAALAAKSSPALPQISIAAK